MYDEQENRSNAFHDFLKHHNILMKDFFATIQKIEKNLYSLSICLDEKNYNHLMHGKGNDKCMENGRLFQLNQLIILTKSLF